MEAFCTLMHLPVLAATKRGIAVETIEASHMSDDVLEVHKSRYQVCTLSNLKAPF